MLVLRNPLDTDSTLTAGIRTDALLGPEESAAAPRPPSFERRRPDGPRRPQPVAATPPPPPAPLAIEAIRAGKRSDEVIK